MHKRMVFPAIYGFAASAANIWLGATGGGAVNYVAAAVAALVGVGSTMWGYVHRAPADDE